MESNTQTRTAEEIFQKWSDIYHSGSGSGNAHDHHIKAMEEYASQFKASPSTQGHGYSKEQARLIFNDGAKWAKEDGIGFNFNDYLNEKYPLPAPPAHQEQGEAAAAPQEHVIPVSEIDNLRNQLYDNLPTGEINAFELLTIISNHIKELDNLTSPTPPAGKE